LAGVKNWRLAKAEVAGGGGDECRIPVEVSLNSHEGGIADQGETNIERIEIAAQSPDVSRRPVGIRETCARFGAGFVEAPDGSTIGVAMEMRYEPRSGSRRQPAPREPQAR